MSVLNSLFGKHAEGLDTPTFRLLLIANVMPAMGIPPISPIMSTLTGVYGVPGSQIGLMITAFTAPSVVMIPVMGALADRYGRKPILVAGTVLFGVGGAAIGLTNDFTRVLGLRLVQGIGFAGMGPVIITSISPLLARAALSDIEGPRVIR